MKTFYPILSLALPLALGLTGCAKEDIAPSTPTSPETKATVFIGGANNKVATRTSLQTDFSSTVSYFWSTGDKIYIEETSGNWLASTGAEKLDEKGASAQFTFASELTEPSYKVYFPGSAAGSQNNVTVIPAIQHQSAPGSTEGLDKNGDSGIGTATLENGVYTFKLLHQPSYLAFLPTAASSTYKLKSISLSAAEPTNGTYLLTENDSEVLALQTAGATATKVVFDYDYIVPQNMQADSAIYMVLPPGIYNNVEIAYTYEDTSTGKTSNYSKRYSRIRLNKNEIKSVNQIINPQILDYTYNATDYYAWGAQDTYPVEGEHAPENGDPSYQSTQDFP
ncbi:MAG: hypothetical protein HUK09_00970, partial [Bacteroidaceae bacterium]|nr:hypothetical protein [Bacteroidaceae bacterium]